MTEYFAISVFPFLFLPFFSKFFEFFYVVYSIKNLVREKIFKQNKQKSKSDCVYNEKTTAISEFEKKSSPRSC
jgi:hypothetical protein